MTEAIPGDGPRVGIIGGGPAGAICARLLAEEGVSVAVLDKARGAGGRLSTRRAGELRFDHGAQFFTARDAGLAPRIAAWEAAGVIGRWAGPFGTLGADGLAPDTRDEPRYVGTPGMNTLVAHLLAGLDVRFGARVTRVERDGARWRAAGETGDLGMFDIIVVAVPAPQAVPLLAGHPFAGALATVEIAPCWTVMARVDGAPDVPWAAVRVEGSALSWIARNQTKPGRPVGEQWVLQASPAWSSAWLEADGDAVQHALVDALTALPGLDGLAVAEAWAHRWRYALVTRPVGQPCLFDPAAGLGVCGDALLGGRVESALVSGAALARRVLDASRP